MQQDLNYSVGGAPRLDAPALAETQETIADIANPRYVTSCETKFEGYVWDVVREGVALKEDTEPFERDFLLHPGAVAVLALNQENKILLINQYRHPVRANLWEIPAGLLDIDGEPPLDAAARELAEETDLRAGRWDTLMEFYNSPGGMGETCRIYLARDLSPIPEEDREERVHEESEIVQRWVPLEEAVHAVLAGRIHNAASTNAILAADAASRRDYKTLYPASAPFTAHPALRDPNYRGEIRPAERL
ncbi:MULTISPECIES: NUDIX domain-containing protein [Rothia]|uniref:NUDIX domain-containing protein n=1 Tax=Rothia TaxID=32207 RepID=UPI001F2B5525|nr:MULTISPECIES: NUDIX hydrolase [Rothia]